MRDSETIVVPPVLDKFFLESEKPLFKMAMLTNLRWAMESLPIGHDASKAVVNPITKLWRKLDANSDLSTSFLEYIKLAQIALIHAVGSVKDE